MVRIRIRAMPPTTEPARIPARLSAKYKDVWWNQAQEDLFQNIVEPLSCTFARPWWFMIHMYVWTLNSVHFSGFSAFTSTGDLASDGFSTPLAVLLALARLGPLQQVPVVAGKPQLSSLQIQGSHFLPVCWRWNISTRHHCVVQNSRTFKTGAARAFRRCWTSLAWS